MQMPKPHEDSQIFTGISWYDGMTLYDYKDKGEIKENAKFPKRGDKYNRVEIEECGGFTSWNAESEKFMDKHTN